MVVLIFSITYSSKGLTVFIWFLIMGYCAIYGCNNSTKKQSSKDAGIKFHRFPKKEELTQKWISACLRSDKLNLKTALICSVHFKDAYKKKTLQQTLLQYSPKNCRYLTDDAVPTEHLPEAKPKSNKEVGRLEREASRGRKRLIDELISEPSTSFTISSEHDAEKTKVVCEEGNLEKGAAFKELEEKIRQLEKVNKSLRLKNEELQGISCTMQSTKIDASDRVLLKTEELVSIKIEPMEEPNSDHDMSFTIQASKFDASDRVLPETEGLVLIKTELTERPDSDQSESIEGEIDPDTSEFILPDYTQPYVEHDHVPLVKSEALQLSDSEENHDELEVGQCSLAERLSQCSTSKVSTNKEESDGISTDLQQLLVTIVDGRKTYSCQECQYKTTHKNNMRNHLTTHSGYRPIKCTLCSYKCGRACDLKRHMITHSGDRAFKCPDCWVSCGRAGELKVHMRTHTKERPYKCTECFFNCARTGDLKKHMTTHTGERRYKCDVCSFSFSQSSHLKTHMNTHTGQKSHKCTVCLFSCSLASNLKKHMACHTGEKRYKCTLCQYSCVQTSDLKTHMNTHTGNRPYKCTVCSYSCNTNSNLKRHLASHSRGTI